MEDEVHGFPYEDPAPAYIDFDRAYPRRQKTFQVRQEALQGRKDNML